MSERVFYEVDGDVAVVRLDDPATLNALSGEMGEALRQALVRGGSQARAIVLTGSDRGFCSGANLADRDLVNGGMFDAGERLEAVFNPMMMAMRDCPVPIVTAVNGAAAGIGASVAMAGDIIVAGEGAYFLQAFRRIGLVPDGGSPFLLVKSVGRVRAMELMLLGEKLPAPRALEWGLITRVVADADVVPAALALARELARGPTRTLGMIRRLAWRAAEASWEEELAVERDLQREAGRTADFREGVAAFLEKRPAVFGGK